MKKGFSLVELLIVCAIIGILATVGGGIARRVLDRAKLNEASFQVVGDLQRARSAAQRFNQGATFTVTSANLAQYTLTISSTPVRTYARALPNGITFDRALSITYNPPFGEVAATTTTLNVALSNSSVNPREIKVLGVTGKVIQ